MLKCLVLLHAHVRTFYLLKQISVGQDINHCHYLHNLSSLTH